MSARNPYLDLALDGVQLVEASAGTGKTWTLATLVTRLVVERGLRIGQVLVVTYTEAATQELRKRIRERLQLTLDLLDAAPGEAQGGEAQTEEAKVTAQLLQAHRQRGTESEAALRRRLRQATVEIDLAAIFTIHGFCARVLRDHALETGQGFDTLELLTSEGDLHAEIAADLWRVQAQDATTLDDLALLWPGGHPALAQDLGALLGRDELVQAPSATADACAAAQAAQAALDAALIDLGPAWLAHGDGFLDRVLAAIEAEVLSKKSYRPEWLQELRGWFATFATNPASAGEPHPKLKQLTAEALAEGTRKHREADTPASPLTAAVAAVVEAMDRLEQARTWRRVALLHRVRTNARTRMALLKRQRRVQGYDDMICGVADALQGAHRDDLVERLRGQYAVALVDEFQDTDTRQWRIFEQVFGNASQAPALFLIGDPKQAIYGFRGGDVNTYLEAAEVARHAPPLQQNFRSRPAVLAAIATLYRQAGDTAFFDGRIHFLEIEPGGTRGDGDFRRNGGNAPALTVWQAPPSGRLGTGNKPAVHSAPDSRALATGACVAAIHALLTEARAGQALIDGQPVHSSDIAVLVRTHHEAGLIQQALVALGIAAVVAGKQSLFASAEARELHALLLSLLHGADDGRLRAALATVLLGVDAQGIDALESDPGQHRQWQLQAERWRERLRNGGPLALVGDLCAGQAERLLGLLDGERRISNYLQLAELLQQAQRRALGLQGLVDWLGHAIATADRDDEAQQLRLESDARCVQIVTLHKSKGLEYPLVFLPFAGIGSNDKSPGRYCAVHEAHRGRRLHWKFDTLPEAGWEAASTAWKIEQRAEQARLLYVGLTRARHGLWIAGGDLFARERSPLANMLADPAALQAAGIVIDTTAPADDLARLPPEAGTVADPARPVRRRLANDWWVYSFSQLARADAGHDTASASTVPASGGNDEPEAAVETGSDADFDPRFSGNRYGVALHAALENADFDAWRPWRADAAAPAGQVAVIAAALGQEGYGAEVLDAGIALTTALIGHTLTVALPEGVRLCELPTAERRAEIEFQFSLQPVRVDELLRLLHAHGIVAERHGFGLRQRLQGLMTGLIDLVYRHDGRWYVLDYKSNRLPSYDAVTLQWAMAHSEYDLQALIYTVALHRWLRFRLGDGYDYARDFGGIRYLFCRGLDGSREDSPGIHAQRFPPELVQGVDALFGHGRAGAGA